MKVVGGRSRIMVSSVVGVLLLVGAGVGLWLSNSTNGSNTTTTSSNLPTTIPFNMKYNAFADVTTGKCSNVSGGWRYVGTIHNSAAVTRRYQIVVDYVSVPGNTVESRQILNVKSVRSHAVVAWSAQGAMGLSNVTCVIEHVQAWPTT